VKIFKVLHIASFTGNIGDNANHLGFRSWFETLLEKRVDWTELEIREFYWKKRFWDESFVDYANTFDLIVIGGGNYFELWVDKSPTGTSVEIEPELYKKIETPVYFNALGVDPGQGASASAIKKFRTFIKAIVRRDGLISVRNDGAMKNLRDFVGEDILEFINEAPDGGFFVNSCIDKQPTLQSESHKIGINVASDMAEVRFKDYANGVEGFSKEFSEAMVKISTNLPGCEFVFFPHIFRDLDVVNKIITYLPDDLRRKYLTVSEYSNGDAAAIRTFSKYSECDLIIGSRFHSNVCSISMGVKSLGLYNYIQIKNLYKGLNQEENLIDIRKPGFSVSMEQKVLDLLKDKSTTTQSQSMKIVTQMRADFEVKLREWLKGKV
jgi:polysaccharide pyruvyl transferase WcaK-like protein